MSCWSALILLFLVPPCSYIPALTVSPSPETYHLCQNHQLVVASKKRKRFPKLPRAILNTIVKFRVTLNVGKLDEELFASQEELCTMELVLFQFIPLVCAECDDSLQFSRASYIPLCHAFFPPTILHQLFFHPLSPHLTIYFLVYLSILLFQNSYIIFFWEFYFLPLPVHAQT
jgi:hypothetical protein